MIRRGLVWLRETLWPAHGNLLGPDVLAEVTIHIMTDFSRKVYVSKLAAPPAVLAKIVESVVRTGEDIGRQHGISLVFAPPGGAPNANPEARPPA